MYWCSTQYWYGYRLTVAYGYWYMLQNSAAYGISYNPEMHALTPQ